MDDRDYEDLSGKESECQLNGTGINGVKERMILDDTKQVLVLTEEKVEEIYKKIAKIFKAERERQHITVLQLEKMTGIDRTAIYKMENCNRRFGFENLIRMCYCLGLELNDLYKVPVEKEECNMRKEENYEND